MSNKRITELTAQTTIDNSDVFAVVDVSQPKTNKVTFGSLKENLPGSSTTTTNNSYLVPVNITVSDGDEFFLTGSTYENTSMIHLDWSGINGTMNLYLPDATTETNTNRSIRFISDNTFSTSTRAELLPLSGSGQTVDGGSTSYTINKAYEGIMVWSDGTEWYRIQTKA